VGLSGQKVGGTRRVSPPVLKEVRIIHMNGIKVIYRPKISSR